MFLLRCERTRGPIAAVIRGCALATTLAIGACASDEEARRETYAHADPYGAGARTQAQAHQQTAQAPRRQDVEDDGLPSQVAPPMNRHREADDPREPYSPNYGRQPAAPQAPSPAAAPAGPPRAASRTVTGPAVAGWSSIFPR